MTGKITTRSTADGSYGGAFEIRERDLITTTDTTKQTWQYAPRISFHWGGRYAKTFGMNYNGNFAIDDSVIYFAGNSNSTSYNWSAKSLTLNGTISGITGSIGGTDVYLNCT